MRYHFSSWLTATLNLCLIYFKITWALAILLEYMHKSFEKKRTKIKGGCQLGRNLVTHNCESDLPLAVMQSPWPRLHVPPEPLEISKHEWYYVLTHWLPSLFTKSGENLSKKSHKSNFAYITWAQLPVLLAFTDFDSDCNITDDEEIRSDLFYACLVLYPQFDSSSSY